MAVRAYLGVSGLDPILIKLMAPEIAPPVVGSVVMTAVQGVCGHGVPLAVGGIAGFAFWFPLQQPAKAWWCSLR